MSNFQEVLDNIRNSANIVDIITERIEVKRRGKNLTALCPFHDDTNPSLSISEPKQIFKCFACGVSGDIFKFVMEFDKLEFKEAVKYLAKKYNVALPTHFSSSEKSYVDPYLKFKLANSWAMEVYHRYLFKAKNSDKARQYIKNRKIKGKLLEAFKIGYAPTQDNFLGKLVREKKEINDVDFKELGLNTENQYGGLRAFFYNRIIFPIISEKNEVLGFGGRTIGDGQPKYLNSKESPWFKKGEILYGFRESYPNLIKKREVYVVEGYLDVMACYEANLPAVAPLGTALTNEQIKKLKRYVDKIHLFFDGDAAGKKAALRSAGDLAVLEADGKVYLLEEGDPFDFIQGNSPDEINKFLSTGGQNIYDFIVTTHYKGVKSPVDKKEKLEILYRLVNQIKNPILKEDFIKKIETQFEISWKNIEVTFKRTIRPFIRTTESSGKNNHNNINKNSSSYTQPTNIAQRGKPNIKQPQISAAEKALLLKERSFILFLCNHPELIRNTVTTLNPKELLDKISSYIYRKLLTVKDEPKLTYNQILELFSSDKEKTVIQFLTDKGLQQESQSTEEVVSEEEQAKDEYKKKLNQQLADDLNQRLVRLKLDYLKRNKKMIIEKIKSVGKLIDGAATNDPQLNEKFEKLQEEKIRLNLEEESLKDYFIKI